MTTTMSYSILNKKNIYIFVMFKCIGLKRSRNYGRYTLNKLWISIDYLQIFTKQYNISYRGQRFQQSTKFV